VAYLLKEDPVTGSLGVVTTNGTTIVWPNGTAYVHNINPVLEQNDPNMLLTEYPEDVYHILYGNQRFEFVNKQMTTFTYSEYALSNFFAVTNNMVSAEHQTDNSNEQLKFQINTWNENNIQVILSIENNQARPGNQIGKESSIGHISVFDNGNSVCAAVECTITCKIGNTLYNYKTYDDSSLNACYDRLKIADFSVERDTDGDLYMLAVFADNMIEHMNDPYRAHYGTLWKNHIPEILIHQTPRAILGYYTDESNWERASAGLYKTENGNVYMVKTPIALTIDAQYALDLDVLPLTSPQTPETTQTSTPTTTATTIAEVTTESVSEPESTPEPEPESTPEPDDDDGGANVAVIAGGAVGGVVIVGGSIAGFMYLRAGGVSGLSSSLL
jgi:hypothetical protein